jgi:flavin-dependent dehydrogenase
MVTRRSTDVVVVGAGTAGAGVALQFARRGRRVVLLEQRRADAGGARWDNGVVRWHFERADLDAPEPPECVQRGTTVMVGPDGRSFALLENPVLDTDMRALGARLLDGAMAQGAEVIDHVRDVRVELRDGRVRGVRCSTAEGGDVAIDAALVVDAGGRLGPVRRQVPTLTRWCPDVTPAGLCSAAQYAHRVADESGARSFLDAHGVQPGDTVSFLGFAGGFSLVSIAVSQDLHHVSVLTGTLGQREWGTGPSLMSWARSHHRWIGEPDFGGAGLIPLRRPYARFTAPGVALVGDAACQMFPAHGSGIGISLVAGAMLAEATSSADDPGDERALWRYQAGFQREHGGTLAAYDVVRRLSTRLGTRGVTEMFRSGLVGPDSSAAALRQEWWSPPPSELPRLAAGLAARPALAAKVLPALGRASAAHRLYADYPAEPDDAALRSWSRRADALLGRAAI